MNPINEICIIDDDRIYQIVMAKNIERADSSVKVQQYLDSTQALTAFSAALAAGEPLPQVVLLDINMPKMNGWDFLAALLALTPHPNTVIYIVSSSIAPQDHERAAQFPVVRQFMVKPVHKDTLDQLLRGEL
jgi:two-component system, chemotaxis family, chemotaxis protein CheY